MTIIWEHLRCGKASLTKSQPSNGLINFLCGLIFHTIIKISKRVPPPFPWILKILPSYSQYMQYYFRLRNVGTMQLVDFHFICDIPVASWNYSFSFMEVVAMEIQIVLLWSWNENSINSLHSDFVNSKFKKKCEQYCVFLTSIVLPMRKTMCSKCRILKAASVKRTFYISPTFTMFPCAQLHWVFIVRDNKLSRVGALICIVHNERGSNVMNKTNRCFVRDVYRFIMIGFLRVLLILERPLNINQSTHQSSLFRFEPILNWSQT